MKYTHVAFWRVALRRDYKRFDVEARIVYDFVSRVNDALRSKPVKYLYDCVGADNQLEYNKALYNIRIGIVSAVKELDTWNYKLDDCLLNINSQINVDEAHHVARNCEAALAIVKDNVNELLNNAKDNKIKLQTIEEFNHIVMAAQKELHELVCALIDVHTNWNGWYSKSHKIEIDA